MSELNTNPLPLSASQTTTAQASASSSSVHMLANLQYACIICKRRKVKCDRRNPCSACIKAGVECVATGRAPYRRAKRLRAVEADRGMLLSPSKSGPDNSNSNPSISDQASQLGDRFRATSISEGSSPVRLSRSKERIAVEEASTFSSNLWVLDGLQEEFRDGPGIVPSESEDDTSVIETSPLDPTALLFAFPDSEHSLRESLPTPAQALALWKIFLQNVNPLSKVVHIPSIQNHLISQANYGSISKATTALMLSIYGVAVISTTNDICEKELGEPRTALLARYISAAQQAFVRARFMKSADLVMLQAFVLYLLAVRLIYDPRSFWLLVGMAVRMGIRLKLHSEKFYRNVPPFEAEMRRRLWWQLLLLDARSAHVAGIQSPQTPNMSDTALPTNLNDADLYPNMAEFPRIPKTLTEMIFCLVRYEFGKFLYDHAQKLHGPVVSLAEKDRLVDELEDRLECKYLRYCDPSQTLHLMASSGARSAICKLRLVIHHPHQYPDKGASLAKAERDLLFSMSMKMVEYDILGQATKNVENYLWHINAYFHLDAFVFMLIETRHHLYGELADRAWHHIPEVFRHHPELITNKNNDLYTAIRELVVRAWDSREAELISHGVAIPEVPSFIVQLRSEKNNRKTKSRSMPQEPEPIQNVHMSYESKQDHNIIYKQISTSNEIQHAQLDDSAMAFGGTMDTDDFLADTNSVDWDYWNRLLEQNMQNPVGSYDMDQLIMDMSTGNQ